MAPSVRSAPPSSSASPSPATAAAAAATTAKRNTSGGVHSARWESNGNAPDFIDDNDDDDSKDDLTRTRNVRLSDNHLLQLALEAAQTLDWKALARPPVAKPPQAAWDAVKIKQPAGAATAPTPTSIRMRVQGERVEAAVHTTVPCSLRELTLVLEAASSAQFCDTMRLVHGEALVSAELVHAVDTGTAATSELLVSAVAFAKRQRKRDRSAGNSSSDSLFRAWRQDDEWCCLDFVQRISPRVVRKTLLSMAQSELLAGREEAAERRRASQQKLKHDVLAGYLFEELEGGRSTRISFWGEHVLEHSRKSSSGILSRALAKRAGKARVLRLAESVDRYILVVRRRRLGVQVMVDEIKVLASNSSCTCCGRSFLLARKRTCNLCGYYVCKGCSRMEERERRVSLSGGGGGSKLAVSHVRICEKCIARVDSCNFGNVSLEDLEAPRIFADSSVATPQRRESAAATPRLPASPPSTGALLTDLLQDALENISARDRSPVLSVIKHIVSLESPTGRTEAAQKLSALTETSGEQEHLEALRSRFADVPRLSLEKCSVANAETRGYLIEHAADVSGTHPHPIPEFEQRRLEIVRGCKLTELEGVKELDAICGLVSKELECMGALVSISDASTFTVVATNIDEAMLPSRTFPRSEGFCSRTIMGVDPLLIPHPESDLRFSYILPVKHLHVSFYCGFPLFAEDFTVIGSLCCLGHESRKLTQSQFTVGKKLAETASRILQQHVRLRQTSERAPQSTV